jgi:DNA-binding transcriptional regulator GbsR (MarR family)
MSSAKSNAASSSEPADYSKQHQETVDRFVQLWGEMASTWGINRTMAQIHALLYCSEAPLNTDDIMGRLDISRGNANMNLRSLTEWNLVDKMHLSGSRKDFYAAKKDVWHITAQIIKERERREIKPVKQQLHTLRDHLKQAPAQSCDELNEEDAALCWRIQHMVELIDVLDELFEALLPLIEKQNTTTIRRLAQLVASIEPHAGDA